MRAKGRKVETGGFNRKNLERKIDYYFGHNQQTLQSMGIESFFEGTHLITTKRYRIRVVRYEQKKKKEFQHRETENQLK